MARRTLAVIMATFFTLAPAPRQVSSPPCLQAAMHGKWLGQRWVTAAGAAAAWRRHELWRPTHTSAPGSTLAALTRTAACEGRPPPSLSP